MKSLVLLLFASGIAFSAIGQTVEPYITTVNKVRFNLINPAFEIDHTTSTKSILTAAIGIGYGGSYPELTRTSGTGFIKIISPFFDIQHKWFTNFEKRNSKGKTTANNSGNFISVRMLTRGRSISENVERTTDTDFAIGPTWGIQRNFKDNRNFVFDIGPIYYFDTEGNWGIFPLNIQLNLGINVK